MSTLLPTICGKNSVYLPQICKDRAYFVGLNDITSNQGEEVDLYVGVTAYNGDDEEIPFTVSPSEVEICEVGTQYITYTAEETVKQRAVTILEISDPELSGLSEDIAVTPGEEFDPLDGVTAIDGNGNPITNITVELAPCAIVGEAIVGSSTVCGA